MSRVCVLTDSTAQFPFPVFPGRNLVNVIPLHVQVDGHLIEKGKGLRAADLPVTTHNQIETKVLAPTAEEFEKAFAQLGQQYAQIITILHTAQLSATAENARQAAATMRGQTTIEVLDAGTTSLGLGLLVQTAAAAAEADTDAAEIKRLLRSAMPRIYTLFCLEGLTYLKEICNLKPAQALLGEFSHILPLFVLENGQLVPTQKARNYRHLVDLLQEFLNEFTEVEHIAILQGAPPFEAEMRALRERIAEDFGPTSISEHTINGTLAAMLGPHSLGLFVTQDLGGIPPA
jgi:DegV family protein with EDD domain